MPVASRRPGFATAALAGLLAATNAVAKDYPADSGWSTFWGAFVDEIVGAPGVEALKPTERFDEAGLAFDYPAVLRVSYDAEDRKWRFWRGDFEFELQIGPFGPDHARQLLTMMGSILHSGDTPADPAESIPALPLCGRDVPGWRVRVTFIGDPHEFLAYSLPLRENESALLLFDDILKDGKASPAREALLESLRSSARCAGG